MILSGLLLAVVEAVGSAHGVLAMALVAPPALLGAGVVATAFTVLAKWLLMGRYRPGEHPLWSFFVWRDEIMNSLQDQLAGTWLSETAVSSTALPQSRRTSSTTG